ncbi:MAG: hypothetical protein QOI25_141 [Mycobacterium sp.]|nr:hypothetical protein [Mycobacterium sp.]
MLYPLSYGGGDGSQLTGATANSVFPAAARGQPTPMSTAKKARNTVDRLAGQAKERIGEVTGNPRLRNEGKADQAKARVKQTGERLKDAVRGR